MMAAAAEQASLASTEATAPGKPADAGPPLPAGCEPPDGLSGSELAFWAYYAPKLRAQRRLTLVARDVLAKYCTALAVVAELRKELAAPKIDAKEKRDARRELRQYLNVTRLYESDLILNPATAVRNPGFDVPPPVDTSTPTDEFDNEFDDEPSSTH